MRKKWHSGDGPLTCIRPTAFSPESGCMQFHSKGIYSIPYRCMVSRDIDNLFFAGRILSATHVAFGSTRVMMTVAHCTGLVGMAAAVCKRKGIARRRWPGWNTF